jgi:hypothetical protein
VKKALEKLRTSAESSKGDATPFLITRHLSAQDRAMCEERRVGFMDLDGNARLVVDEIFIGKRSVRNAPASSRIAHRLPA